MKYVRYVGDSLELPQFVHEIVGPVRVAHDETIGQFAVAGLLNPLRHKLRRPAVALQDRVRTGLPAVSGGNLKPILI